jgi:putative transcription factor
MKKVISNGKDVAILSRIQQCEMCGAEAPVTLVEIDHVELFACSKCAKFGKPVVKKRQQKQSVKRTITPSSNKRTSSKTFKTPKKEFLDEKILVDGYGTIIQEARRSRGLGRAEFAKMIKEKETLLARIEAEKVLPTDRIVAKIERELDIELKTEISEEGSVFEDTIPKSTTIGSIAKIKRRKK